MAEFDTLFYKDPYLKQFTSVVVDCVEAKGGYQVVLKDTAFYPEGGGQPADYGSINGIKVYDVRKKDGIIYHYTKEPLEINSSITGIIDWTRRFDHMQQHSGEHIFSGIVHKLFGYDNIGFHLGDDVITLDFSGPLDWEKVMQVENEANQLIYRNVEIIEHYPDSQQLEEMDFRSKKELKGEVRIIEIPDGDVCACCGTHVRFTGEIGLIKALSCANKGEGSRVTILCGKRALTYLQSSYDQMKALSVSLAAKPLEVERAVNHLQDVIAQQKTKIYNLQKSYFEGKINSYPESDGVLIVFEKEIESNDFRKYVDDLITNKKGRIIAGFNENSNGFNYVIISNEVPLRALSKELNTRLNGRGGGSEQMLQGSCKATKEEIEEVVYSIFK